MVSRFLLFLVCMASLAGSVCAAEGTVNSLRLWTRKAGPHSDDQNPPRLQIKTAALDQEELERRTLKDIQYGGKRTYRGLPLATILRSYPRSSEIDTAILHFENGMAVPVPVTGKALKRLDIFVALQICPSAKECSKEFPEIARENAYSTTDDPRPIQFSWNKLVLATPYHPDVPSDRLPIFSPWRHVDTLSGIEFVSGEAYFRQFDLGEGQGQEVFRQRCQFCHGVRYVGARFGWDFVTPLPIAEKRSPEHLLNHVKYPKAMAMKMGLMMPVQRDVELGEMRAIWRWMRKAAAKSLPAYKP